MKTKKSKEERKAEALIDYRRIERPAWIKYLEKCTEINKEVD